jgi:phosphoglucosamine mutase
VEEKKPLSELAKIMKVYPQVLLNVKVEDKSKYAGNARIEEAIKKAEETMGERGRIVVRPSGTEPLIRVMVEGEDEAEINRVAEDIAAVIKEELR